MKIFDISWPITHDCTTYKNRNDVSCTSLKQFERDNVRETLIQLNVHTGTHVDAPAHFLATGATVDAIPLEQLIGPCLVIDLMHVQDAITQADLMGHAIEPESIVLFKTLNSNQSPTASFCDQFIYLDSAAASYLAEKKIKAVGIDYLGIERNQPSHDTHRILMQADIVIVEGLRLKSVEEGSYLFICLPLNLIGLEAAPARAMLVSDWE